MKKSILIFRSANYDVIFSLLDYIFGKYNQIEIYLIVQKESIKILKDKYPNINYIINEDGFFKYEEYLKNTDLRNKIECRYYDEIYIPSSTVEITGFYEIECITSKVKKGKVLFYNCLGELKSIRINKFYLEISNFFEKNIQCFLNFVYFFIYKMLFYICLLASNFNIKN